MDHQLDVDIQRQTVLQVCLIILSDLFLHLDNYSGRGFGCSKNIIGRQVGIWNTSYYQSYISDYQSYISDY